MVVLVVVVVGRFLPAAFFFSLASWLFLWPVGLLHRLFWNQMRIVLPGTFGGTEYNLGCTNYDKCNYPRCFITQYCQYVWYTSPNK